MKIALNRCPHGIEMLSLDHDNTGTRFCEAQDVAAMTAER